MKKLKLDFQDLTVDSFSTEPVEESKGTVVGRDTHPWTQGWDCQSYGDTCYNTGCNTGLTSTCGTAGATDCPGQSECGAYTQDQGNTCVGSCTDVGGCTFCGAVC